MKKEYDVVVIGAGASGLTAAICAKRNNPNARIAVFEKKDKPAKKLSATGNGRANLSNVNCSHVESVLDFLSSCGISVREEEGRIYPYSEDAGAVAVSLVKSAECLGVEIFLNKTVKSIESVPGKNGRNNGFDFWCENDINMYHTDRLILSTGGKSYASFGTTGDGYIFARKLGHKVSKLAPALTAVEVLDNIKSLKGVRIKAKSQLIRDAESIYSETGEVQFREDSVSGIPIMNTSTYIRPVQGETPEDGFKHYTLKFDLVPDFTLDEVKKMILSRLEIKGFDENDAIRTLVKEPMANYIVRKERIFFAGKPGKTASIEEISDYISNELKSFELRVRGLKGWNEAQVTSGGVDLGEINPESMESRILAGLYITGELLDYAGPCGGYNLNNAFYTGMIAGNSIK